MRKFWAVFTAVLSLAAYSNCANAQSAQQEVDKQVAKLIGDAITSRIAQSLIQPSAEQNSAWLSHTRTRISFSSAGFTGRGTVPITIAGYDRTLNPNLTAGAAASYARQPSGLGARGHSWSVEPYLAYRFNDNVFTIAKVNYGEGDTDIVGGGNSDSEMWGADVSLNGLYKWSNFLAKGRAGVGVSDGRTRTTIAGATFRTDSSSTRYVGDAELGYFFMPDLYGFAGVQLNDSNRSNSYQSSARIGLEKQFTRQVTASLKYEQQIDDNLPSGVNVRVRSLTVAARLAF